MAGFDPYSPCPCGSGEKFKWCCQKVESYVEKADRLYEGNQIEAALDALAEGLRKHPENALLVLRKASIELREDRVASAAETLRTYLVIRPHHFQSRMLLARAVLDLEGPVSASAHLQNALGLAEGDDRIRLAGLYDTVAYIFGRMGNVLAAFRHFEQARQLEPNEPREDGSPRTNVIRDLMTSPEIPIYAKSEYRLSPTPDGLPTDLASRFDEALSWAESGSWNVAASAFEALSADGAGSAADRNLGLLRVWVGDTKGAIPALRRAVSGMGETIEAVDLEALRQLLEPEWSPQTLDEVQLTWPLRNREALLDKLRSQADVVDEGPGPIDPGDEKSPEVQHFLVLDRPNPKPAPGWEPNGADLPRVVFTAFVGKDIAGINTVDDKDLSLHIDRFTALAVPAVPPAHPKTKIIGRTNRAQIDLSPRRYIPDGLEDLVVERIQRAESSRLISEVWTKLESNHFDGKSPLEASKRGGSRTALRAAAMIFESSYDLGWSRERADEFRKSLGLEPEPTIDPTVIPLREVNLVRYSYVEIDKLTTRELLEYYLTARTRGLRAATAAACARLIDDAGAREELGVPLSRLYADLAGIAAAEGDRSRSLELLASGRASLPSDASISSTMAWEILEIRLKSRVMDPTEWVPDLATVIERYQDDPEASQGLILGLVGLGLIHMTPEPDSPDRMLVDTRPLRALLTKYGPRITTSSGVLGVSATKSGVWTPDSETSGKTTPGGIWTPGSTKPAEGEKPKLYIPGR